MIIPDSVRLDSTIITVQIIVEVRIMTDREEFSEMIIKTTILPKEPRRFTEMKPVRMIRGIETHALMASGHQVAAQVLVLCAVVLRDLQDLVVSDVNLI